MAEIIFAMDIDDLGQAREWVEELAPEINFFKIGLQLFTLYGPEAVKIVQARGKNVFLDLKINDIPNTCAKATEAAAKLGCYSLTIHISAGEEALKSSVSGREDAKPHLWGVTILSSIGTGNSLERARIAKDCGLDGVIVSGDDVETVRSNFSDLELVVPGIRPADSNTDDQKRVLTPKEAVEKGADFLVIGRPIRNSSDPLKLVRQIKTEINS
ncbi:orotidine-5'-phosphate decarboxylase [Elusimicrobiota bacterium]